MNVASATTFASVAPTLWAAGHYVVPVLPGQKRPPRLEWKHYQTEPQDVGTVEQWVRDFPRHGVGLVLRDGTVHLDADKPETLDRIRDLPSAWENPHSRKHPGGGGALVRVPDPIRNLDCPGWEVRVRGYAVLPDHGGRRSLHGLSTEELVRAAPTLPVSELADRIGVSAERLIVPQLTPKHSLLSSELSSECSALELSSECVLWSLARFSEPGILPRVATVLGFPTVEFQRPFLCVLHRERRPSAELVLGKNGVAVYRDWHGPRHGAPEILTLPEVRHAQVSGIVRQLRGPELATWALRLLVEAGVMQPAEVDMPPLPSWVAKPIRQTYEGFRLLLGCRWLHTYGDPAPFTWDFAAAWCGGLPRKDVGAAILHLRREGVLRLAGQHQRANLYLPGDGR